MDGRGTEEEGIKGLLPLKEREGRDRREGKREEKGRVGGMLLHVLRGIDDPE